MTLALIGALEIEVAPLVRALRAVKAQAAPLGKVYRAVVGDEDVWIAELGMGKVRAAAVLQSLIDVYRVNEVICFGSAGALNPQCNVGDIIVARRVTQHDFRLMLTPTILGDRHTWLKTDARWSKRLLAAGRRLGHTVALGSIVTGDQVIAASETRYRLWTEFRADCVEMEGAAVGIVCGLNDIPFAVVRGLTDRADEYETTSFRQRITDVSETVANVVAECVRAR
ncbi:MAG: 5'-methylthioadenosine/S-adenosylhomocysteine nucleosidase [Chloroflexota bacterium]